MAVDLYVNFIGLFTILAYLKYPVAAGLLEKSSFRQEQCRSLIAQEQSDLQGLPFPDAYRRWANKHHIHIELAVHHLGKYLFDNQVISLVRKLKIAFQAGKYSRDVMILDTYPYFKTRSHIYLPYFFTRFFVLPNFRVEGG